MPHDHHHHHHHHDHDHDHDHGGPLRPADPAQESLVSALRWSFNLLRVLMIVLVVLYAFSGVLQVGPGQQGLISRLGVLREGPAGGYVFPPDWYLALPEPFDQKFLLTGQVLASPITTFMFAHPDAATSKNLSEIAMAKQELQPGVDGAMLTGDRNLSHGRWEFQYQIVDASRFVANIAADPNAPAFTRLFSRLAETAVVREVAGRTVEQVTRLALDDVRAGVQRRLQGALDRIDAGVRVTDVIAYTIEPGAVRDAFADVTRAENESRTSVSQAQEKATETLNRAAGARHRDVLDAILAYGAAQLDDDAGGPRLPGLREKIDEQLLAAEQENAGQAAIKLRAARSAANETSQKLRERYERFISYLRLREGNAQTTVVGLWSEMRSAVLGTRANEVFYVPESDVIEILVNRDPQRQKELEEDQARARQEAARP